MTSQKHTERETKMNDYFTITYRHKGIKTYDFQVEYISENGEHISQKLENLILHRPYFGMKGNTRDVWEVNPYRKLGCDAAPTDAEAMTPDEYIKMVEDKSNVK